jgi:hypothetical protein
MNEILVFQNTLQKYQAKLAIANYKNVGSDTYNTGENNMWHDSTFYNEVLNKKLIFTLFPCSRNLTRCQITVVIVGPNGSSIDLSDFMAFKKKQARIDYADSQEYAFKLEVQNIKESIETQLQKIIDLLFNEFRPYFLENDWLNISIKDPRDDY